MTLKGKGVTVIWMFFGILAFGVFCRHPPTTTTTTHTLSLSASLRP